MKPNRIRVGRIPIDSVTLDQALIVIDELVRAKKGGTVFTPNADHVVVSELSERFQKAYEAVDLSLVDGVPVLWASRFLGRPLPAKISGSDLVMPLLRHARDNCYRVFFLGADPGVAEHARAEVERELPGSQIVGVMSPRISVDGDMTEIIDKVNQTHPDIVLVALGAPKQEIFCQEHRERLGPAVLIGVGASLDFIAGVKRRAPIWVSAAGLEWLFRLAQEPRRLAYRYLVRDPQFFGIVWRQWRTARGAQSSSI